MLRDLSIEETNDLGRRIMKPRRIRLPNTTRSIYSTSFKNFTEISSDKFPNINSFNLE